MITENQVPATLVLQIEAMIAVGGLSPAQAGTFRQAADRIEKQDKRISELEDALKHIARHFGSAEQCREIAGWALNNSTVASGPNLYTSSKDEIEGSEQ